MLMQFGTRAQTQTPFFSPVAIVPGALNPQQKVIYDKAVNFGIYKSFQIVQVNPFSTSLQADSLLNIEAQGLACYTTARFVTRNLEYKADTDFYWFGQFAFSDSASDCYQGEAMFFTDTGRYYGYFTINNQNYELMDLGNGLQLLAEVDSNFSKGKICGTQAGEQKSTGNTSPDGWGGYQCKPKLLVLFTQDALNSDPMGWSRGVLAFNQTRQALLNSGVSVFQLGLMYKADVVNYNTPAWLGNRTPDGLEKALKDMKNPNDPLSYDVSYKQMLYKADMVVLLTKYIQNDINVGQADNILYQPPPTPNPKPYAAVQTTSATLAGYTFAHEVGHIMGGQHCNDGSPGSDFNSGLGHAHRWTWETKTGIWPFRKTHYNERMTTGYQNTGGSPTVPGNTAVILQFSNPDLQSDGQATGRQGDRDAAHFYKQVGCVVADFNPDPDPFTIGISGEANRGFNNVFTNGKHYFCDNSTVYLTAWATGPSNGNYNYFWEYSSDGINWSYYLNSTNALAINIPLPNSNTFRDYWIRLTVTSPSGQQLTEYYPIRIVYCSPHIYHKSSSSSGTAGEAISNTVAKGVNRLHTEATLDKWTVSPNPANQELVLDIQLSSKASVDYALYDMMGRKIMHLASPVSLSEGVHRLYVNVAALPAGIYQLVYKQDDKQETKKITIVR